jgi:hypothetical protein
LFGRTGSVRFENKKYSVKFGNSFKKMLKIKKILQEFLLGGVALAR